MFFCISNTGFVDLSFTGSTLSNYGSPYQTAQYRIVDDQVYLRGLIWDLSYYLASNSFLLSLPAGVAPQAPVTFPSYGKLSSATYAMYSAEIRTTGQLYSKTVPSTIYDFVFLDGLSFHLILPTEVQLPLTLLAPFQLAASSDGYAPVTYIRTVVDALDSNNNVVKSVRIALQGTWSVMEKQKKKS